MSTLDDNLRASRRSSTARQLAFTWIKLNRPDVWNACLQEAAKEFPFSRGPQKVHVLPASISNIPAFEPKPTKEGKK